MSWTPEQKNNHKHLSFMTQRMGERQETVGRSMASPGFHMALQPALSPPVPPATSAPPVAVAAVAAAAPTTLSALSSKSSSNAAARTTPGTVLLDEDKVVDVGALDACWEARALNWNAMEALRNASSWLKMTIFRSCSKSRKNGTFFWLQVD